MVQWINVLWNNSFVNLTQLPLLCRNSRAVILVEPGFTAGWLAGWLSDKIPVNFKFLKFITDQIFKLFAAFNKVTALLKQYECIQVGIFSKSLFKVVVRSVKIGKAIVFLVDPYY